MTGRETLTCPVCKDVISGDHSNYAPTWSDIHDDVVCNWCARVTIHPTDTEWITCECGNDPRSDGFDTVDADGFVIEPNVWDTWDGLYQCVRCTRLHAIAEPTREAKQADERGYRAMLIRTNGQRPDECDVIDMVADVLTYAAMSLSCDSGYIVERAMARVSAELAGDDLTTFEVGK